ncbi:MAG: glycosyltransferase [Pyrinomonadaceae bacterium]
MRTFFEWFKEKNFDANHPWLIYGKGPSFAKRHAYDVSHFHTLALNHAVREQRVMVAHAIDLEVVDACGEAIEHNAEVLVLPWMPHTNNSVGAHNLVELARHNQTLRRMNERQRLLWYNLSSGPQKQGDSPIVNARFFSAEAVLNLLAQAGARRVRSLGIDGGVTYSREFDDLQEKTLLANGHVDFDIQFSEIAAIILNTGLDYAPLDAAAPVRIFVGSTESEMLAVKVLEYSIRKHAPMSVQVVPLHQSGIEIPMPREAVNRPRTPFSFQRFLIPQLMNYAGRAIYVDSDMQVFRDIRELWMLPFAGAEVLAVRAANDDARRPQFSVMLLDCEALRGANNEIVKALDVGEMTYEQLMGEMVIAKSVRSGIDPCWNALEQYEEGTTRLLHYTDMPLQPWVSPDNALGHLWMRDLFEAIDNKVISADFVAEQVMKGHVRPSLLHQLAHRIEDGCVLRKSRLLDKFFVAPYKTLHRAAGASPWAKGQRAINSVITYLYQNQKFTDPRADARQ